jgi:voltage-gated sodium channel
MTFAELNYPKLTKVVKSEGFESAMGGLIVLNCMTMGIGAETLIDRANGWKGVVATCEHVFTLVFVAELALRVFVYGWRFFVPFVGDMGHFIDAALVLVTGVLMVWILPLFRIADSSVLRTISVLRVCRLARLVRVVAKVRLFHEVWQLMRGLTESTRTLFWTIIVICFITYIFAVFGVVLIGSELKAKVQEADGMLDPELEALMEHFDGIFCTMQTLIQLLLLDSVHGILHPLMKYVGWSWLFFYAYISIAVIVLLNLVTAIIVDNAMKNSQKDEDQKLTEKETEKQKHLAQFRSLFELMDVDGDGQITWREFENAFEVPEVATKLKMLDFTPESCHELFFLLDHGDGSLTLDEFFEGISNMDGNAKAKDSFKLLKLAGILQRSLQQFANDVQEDHAQILQHFPGCSVVPRLGSLRARSLKNEISSVVSSPTRRGAESRSARVEEPPMPPFASEPALQFHALDFSVGPTGATSPVSGSARRLPPLPAAPRECSVDTVGFEGEMTPALEGDMSPARRRKKHLGAAPNTPNIEAPGDCQTLARVNEVAEQVAQCNNKVDHLAESIYSLQASMAMMLQRLDFQHAPDSQLLERR